jgi:hypothetical protein
MGTGLVPTHGTLNADSGEVARSSRRGLDCRCAYYFQQFQDISAQMGSYRPLVALPTFAPAVGLRKRVDKHAGTAEPCGVHRQRRWLTCCELDNIKNLWGRECTGKKRGRMSPVGHYVELNIMAVEHSGHKRPRPGFRGVISRRT